MEIQEKTVIKQLISHSRPVFNPSQNIMIKKTILLK